MGRPVSDYLPQGYPLFAAVDDGPPRRGSGSSSVGWESELAGHPAHPVVAPLGFGGPGALVEAGRPGHGRTRCTSR